VKIYLNATKRDPDIYPDIFMKTLCGKRMEETKRDDRKTIERNKTN
jgi:hypothetical protein